MATFFDGANTAIRLGMSMGANRRDREKHDRVINEADFAQMRPQVWRALHDDTGNALTAEQIAQDPNRVVALEKFFGNDYIRETVLDGYNLDGVIPVGEDGSVSFALGKDGQKYPMTRDRSSAENDPVTVHSPDSLNKVIDGVRYVLSTDAANMGIATQMLRGTMAAGDPRRTPAAAPTAETKPSLGQAQTFAADPSVPDMSPQPKGIVPANDDLSDIKDEELQPVAALDASDTELMGLAEKALANGATAADIRSLTRGKVTVWNGQPKLATELNAEMNVDPNAMVDSADKLVPKNIYTGERQLMHGQEGAETSGSAHGLGQTARGMINTLADATKGTPLDIMATGDALERVVKGAAEGVGNFINGFTGKEESADTVSNELKFDVTKLSPSQEVVQQTEQRLQTQVTDQPAQPKANQEAAMKQVVNGTSDYNSIVRGYGYLVSAGYYDVPKAMTAIQDHVESQQRMVKLDEQTKSVVAKNAQQATESFYKTLAAQYDLGTDRMNYRESVFKDFENSLTTAWAANAVQNGDGDWKNMAGGPVPFEMDVAMKAAYQSLMRGNSAGSEILRQASANPTRNVKASERLIVERELAEHMKNIINGTSLPGEDRGSRNSVMDQTNMPTDRIQLAGQTVTREQIIRGIAQQNGIPPEKVTAQMVDHVINQYR